MIADIVHRSRLWRGVRALYASLLKERGIDVHDYAYSIAMARVRHGKQPLRRRHDY